MDVTKTVIENVLQNYIQKHMKPNEQVEARSADFFCSSIIVEFQTLFLEIAHPFTIEYVKKVMFYTLREAERFANRNYIGRVTALDIRNAWKTYTTAKYRSPKK